MAPRLRRPLRMRSGVATVCGAVLRRACPALPGVVVLRLLDAAALEGTFLRCGWGVPVFSFFFLSNEKKIKTI